MERGTIASVQVARKLSERSMEQLLWEVVAARVEGLAVLRDRDGLRHGVWVQRGFVVGIHVAGSFDPLLDRLRKGGDLSCASYRACVEALFQTRCRSGVLAIEVAGLARAVVRDALKEQARGRMRALLAIADERGHDALFEACPVPDGEVGVRMPLGALFRHAEQGQPPPRLRREPVLSREQARRKLRQVAFDLHPDRHRDLGPEARRQLERDLAAATAAYHGLAG